MTTTLIAVIVGVFIVLDRVGVLERLKLTRPSATAAADELKLADRAIDRLTVENAKLTAERTNEPVLKVLAEISRQLAETARAQQVSAESQGQVIDRLAAHNGSFRHMEESLGLVVSGLQTLMSTIADLHDIPMKEKP